ncbi:OsmC family protein [Marinilabilia rubra]|uniref:Osmotically inducible protein OsmC n=1 Tax=Marinilabilia rubra TaxID=2162893 RepID=A0A2U2BB46_9BACT|nr:OsmC family protein [Marinilabilia rubra]PWE00278.1 osmotically inducible protein OsmC [Marinilabilia rubra]
MSVTIKSRYLGNLRVESTHLQSGNQLITDAPLDNRGKGEAFSPTDLLATSLGSCIMTIMGITAMDNNIDIEGTEVDVTKIMASDPRRVSEIVVEFYFPDRGYTADQEQIIEKVAGISPVPLSLAPKLKQTIRFHW